MNDLARLEVAITRDLEMRLAYTDRHGVRTETEGAGAWRILWSLFPPPVTEGTLAEVSTMHVRRILDDADTYEEAARRLGVNSRTLRDWRRSMSTGGGIRSLTQLNRQLRAERLEEEALTGTEG